VPGEANRVELSDGRAVEGELDEFGAARLEDAPRGACAVAFPGRAADAVVRIAADGEVLGRAEPAGAEGGARFAECPAGRLRFRLGPPKLDLHLYVGAEAEASEDAFVLYSTDAARTYERRQAEREGAVPGDGFLDLRWDDLDPTVRYSLAVEGPDGARSHLFRDLPFAELQALEASVEDDAEDDDRREEAGPPGPEDDARPTWDDEEEPPDDLVAEEAP